MYGQFRIGVMFIALCPLVGALSACDATGGGGGEFTTVEEKKSDEAKSNNDETKKVAKRDETHRKLEIGRQKLDKSRLSGEHGEVEQESKITKAEQDLLVATTKLEQLEQFTAPTRLARAELSLQNAEDRYLEAQEEMTQLELMYGEEDFADKTKEIVLERGKRRLERSRRNLEIQRRDLEFLNSHSLPLEIKEQQFKVEQAQKQLEKARRDARSGDLDGRIAILSAEAEVAKSEFELHDLEKETEEK